MAKSITAEKASAGLRHAVVCPNVTGRTKERVAQSKRVRAGSLALVDQPQVARTCILRADVVLSFFVSQYFCTIVILSLYAEYVVRFFPFRMVFFHHVITGWIFYISLLLRDNKIK